MRFPHPVQGKLVFLTAIGFQPRAHLIIQVKRIAHDGAGISQKVLTDSLRSMEADGIIDRTVYAEVSPRVEYALSEIGETLRPVIDAMAEWGGKYKGLLK